MSIAELLNILPPPQHPQYVPTAIEWQAVGERLGPLPDDYRQFIEIYGDGSIDFCLFVLMPDMLAAPDDKMLAAPNEARGVFPAPGGLLRVAHDDAGGVLWWIAKGHPSAWKMAVRHSRAVHEFLFAGSLTQFLCAALTDALPFRSPLVKVLPQFHTAQTSLAYAATRQRPQF